MKSRELTPEAISASTYRDGVQDAITAAIQTAYSQASKSGLMGAPGAEKIKKRFKEEFPAVLKNQLEQGVEPIKLAMFGDATWDAAVNPHNQSLVISYKMTDMISDWVASAITYGAKTGAEIVSEVKKPVDYLSGVIVHEIVHLIQQQRQPGKRKDYHSLLKSSADRFISAVQNLASDEDWDLYHASPQEIPAYAHQMIYRMITQALNGEQLRDIPEDEIPFVIQELRDLLRDVATGVNASGDEIERYLKFKGEDRRRVTVFKRFMKAVYLEVQSYIGQLQAGYRGGQPVTESFDSPYPFKKTVISANNVMYTWTMPTEDATTSKQGTCFFYPALDSNGKSGRWEMEFVVDGEQTVTGGGNAFATFSTVLQCFKDWASTEGKDAQSLGFSANSSEPSRVKLYNRFAKMMPKFGFKLSNTQSSGKDQVYRFDRIKSLNETFDQPYPIRKKSQFDRVDYMWTGDDGRRGAAQFRLEDSDMNSWGLIFMVDDVSTGSGTIKQSGGGDAQRIFATVFACLRDWLANEGKDAYGLSFAADRSEPSRVKLYDRFARIMPRFGFEDTHSSFQPHHSKFYEFTRIGMEPPEQHEPELIPPEEQIEEAAIYEVGFSHEVADIDNEQAVIDHSKIDGSISGKDVWRFHNANIDLTIYFFTDNQESIQAWVMLNGNNLMAMKSYSSGLNFALMHYIIDLKGIRLEIKATDTLTADGLKWILGQITRRDGFKITDQRNRPIDPDRLKKEWRRAQSQGPGPTAIWIGESAIASNLRLFEASPTHNDRFGIRQSNTQQVAETFNSPVEAKWLMMGTANGTANFTVGDVDYQYVYYVKQKSRDGKPLWVWVEFKTAGAKGKYGLTGTGNAAQVLATATHLTRELLDKFPSIYKLIFSAKEKSRQSLYAHMIRRLLPTWETDTKKDRNGLTFTVINNTALAESSLTEIERIPGQDFPIEKTQQILSHCTHDDGDSIDGLKLWMGRNGSERYVILTDDNRNIASYAGFHAIDSHRWQVRNAQTYPGFTGRKLAAKIYKELFDGGVSILSDFQQSSGAEHIWCKNLPAMGVTPMVWDSKSEEIYTADQIGMDKIYSQDPKIMHRYCWILEHHIPSQNLVYEGKMLMPIKGLWYTKRLRFDEMASAGATGSGSVATVAQPLGGVIRRPAIGSSILAGINTAEATPNTPDWMKRYKNRSQNKKRSK